MAISDHDIQINRTSEFIPIPENQQTLDRLTPSLVTFLIILNIITSVIGGVGNILTLFVIYIRKSFHTVTHLFAAHLCTINVIISGFIVPISLISLISNTYGVRCWVVGPMIVITLSLSMSSMANIAACDYLKICRGHEAYNSFYTRRNTVLILLICYIFSLSLIIPPSIGLGMWTANAKFKICLFSAYDLYSYIYLSAFLDGLAFTPPAIVCGFSYYKIIKELHKSGVSRITKNRVQSHDGEVITDARAADMFRLILAGMAVSIVFLVCWSPLIFITQVDFWGRWRADVYIAAWSFANFNSCFNAMLYARFHKEYSVAYKLLLTCQWRKLRNESLNDEDYRNDFN